MATQSQLVMRSGPTPGKTFALTKNEMYIGRDISNDIVINDAEVSRKHVRLILQAGQYVLEDLGSTNGTFINGQRISGPQVLQSEQTIQMGENVVLVFEQVSFDPDATAVMAPQDQTSQEPISMPDMGMDELEEEPAPMAPPVQAQPQAPPPPPPQPAPAPIPPAPQPAETYTGPAPAEPMEMEEEEQPKSNRTAILVGCGCLVVVVCVAVIAGLYYIDANSLWCDYFSFLPSC
jgi:predicted component of type VI protein secretion system